MLTFELCTLFFYKHSLVQYIKIFQYKEVMINQYSDTNANRLRKHLFNFEYLTAKIKGASHVVAKIHLVENKSH